MNNFFFVIALALIRAYWLPDRAWTHPDLKIFQIGIKLKLASTPIRRISESEYGRKLESDYDRAYWLQEQDLLITGTVKGLTKELYMYDYVYVAKKIL